ncbi:MAG: hypothetical protein OHK0015_56000 [Chloroflexi bacterium OHK40]
MVNIVHPLTTGNRPVRGEGRAIHVGGRSATAKASLTDSAGMHSAPGTASCRIFHPEPELHR